MGNWPSDIPTALAAVTAGIGAIGALGIAASGLLDATKVLGGGISKVGFKTIRTALAPFKEALANGDSDWISTIQANWINGAPKEEQKATAKSLIRLGLSSANVEAMALAGHVEAAALRAVLEAIETGAVMNQQQINLLGRFNAAIDAALDGAFERADQQYRNASRLWSGILAIGLSLWAGVMLYGTDGKTLLEALFVGVIAVPLAPVAKDLTSALQAAAGAMKAVRS